MTIGASKEDLQITLECIRQGALSFDELEKLHFNPYYPYQRNQEDFSLYSQQGIESARSFFLQHEDELVNNGMLGASIVGSASVGLAVPAKHNYVLSKQIDADGQISLVQISQGDLCCSDIDIRLLAEKRNRNTLNNVLGNLQESYDDPMSKNFSMHVTPLEEVTERIAGGYIPTLVGYGLWCNRIPLYGESIIKELTLQAQRVIKELLPEERKKVFGFAADFSLFQKYLRQIKLGPRKFIYLTRKEISDAIDYL